MRKHLRFFWPAFAATTLVAAFINHCTYRTLLEQNDLLKQLVEKQKIENAHLLAVNDVCGETLVDTMQRLGLDDQAMPLIPTVYWRRLTEGLRITEARRLLGAKKVATGFLSSNILDVPAVGPVDPPCGTTKACGKGH